MNILIIGNGFDLAHELPTRYSDFLEFCKIARRIYSYVEGRSVDLFERENLLCWEINEEIKAALKEAYRTRKYNRIDNDDGTYNSEFQTEFPRLDELYSCIKSNVWIEYFLQCDMYQRENWIDFETEISKVIQVLDEVRKIILKQGDIYEISDDKSLIVTAIRKAAKKELHELFGGLNAIDVFISSLNKDLDYLIRALEIYLSDYVDKIVIDKKVSELKNIMPERVLSFNYSNTFAKIYGGSKKIEYDYIHGKADVNNTVESNNMVLGIDEYLPDETKDKEVEFIAFKKFYQRIHKMTGCRYRKWADIIKEDWEHVSNKSEVSKQISEGCIGKITGRVHRVYVFGHSLDVTDKDILRALILNDNVYTTIYYLNKKVYGQQIANLVKVIGQDELIKRTGGRTKTIEFKQQSKSEE